MSLGRAGVLRGRHWARQLSEAIAQPPLDTTAWMEHHTRILKSDRFGRVGLLELGGELNFLKYYRQKSLLQQFGFWLGRGRGVRAYDMGEALAERHIPVPRPRACLLVPGGMLLLTEGLSDARDLKTLWESGRPPADAGDPLECAAQTLGRLHLAGYAHGDCKWSNLLWCDGCLYLVDLEAVRSEIRGGRKQARDLARFTLNAEELGVKGDDYQRFVVAYSEVVGAPRDTVVERLLPDLLQLRARHRERYGERGAALL